MRGFGWVALAGIGGWACSGEPPAGRPELEICDDGVDNDEDGLVDCDDAQDCGPMACRPTTGDDDDTTEEPPLVEVLFDPTACCDFGFAPSDCPEKEIGSFEVVNRSRDEEALLDVYCEEAGGGSEEAVQWKPEGGSQVRPTVANARIAPEETLTIVGVFVCASGVNQTFNIDCTIFVENMAQTEEDEHRFTITGTAP